MREPGLSKAGLCFLRERKAMADKAQHKNRETKKPKKAKAKAAQKASVAGIIDRAREWPATGKH
jgi:hypothetical protein